MTAEQSATGTGTVHYGLHNVKQTLQCRQPSEVAQRGWRAALLRELCPRAAAVRRQTPASTESGEAPAVRGRARTSTETGEAPRWQGATKRSVDAPGRTCGVQGLVAALLARGATQSEATGTGTVHYGLHNVKQTLQCRQPSEVAQRGVQRLLLPWEFRPRAGSPSSSSRNRREIRPGGCRATSRRRGCGSGGCAPG